MDHVAVVVVAAAADIVAREPHPMGETGIDIGQNAALVLKLRATHMTPKQTRVVWEKRIISNDNSNDDDDDDEI